MDTYPTTAETPSDVYKMYLETVVSVPGRARAGREQHRLAQEAAVPAAELSEQAEGDGAVVERGRPEVVAECRHHVGKHLFVRSFVRSFV